MAWVRDRYYVRTFRQDGRVVCQYVGGGARGQEAADSDAQTRLRRRAGREERARWEERDRALKEYCAACDWLVRAALFAAGYRQHDRGEWRKRREDRRHHAGPAG